MSRETITRIVGFALALIICFGGAYYGGRQAGREDGRSAVESATRMAGVAQGIVGLVEEFRGYRERTEEYQRYLEENNRRLGELVISFEAVEGELFLISSEFDERIRDLESALPRARNAIDGVAEDIGRVIDGAESGETEAD